MLHLNMSFSLAIYAFPCPDDAALHRPGSGPARRTRTADCACRAPLSRCQTRPSPTPCTTPIATVPRRSPYPLPPHPASPPLARNSSRACSRRRCPRPTWSAWRRPPRRCSAGMPASVPSQALSRPLSATSCPAGPTRLPRSIPDTSSASGPGSSATAARSGWRRPTRPRARGKSSSRAPG
ncbi:hypothetical protein D3C72_1839150 [compost metagenome]